jgi:hypothetical protein
MLQEQLTKWRARTEPLNNNGVAAPADAPAPPQIQAAPAAPSPSVPEQTPRGQALSDIMRGFEEPGATTAGSSPSEPPIALSDILAGRHYPFVPWQRGAAEDALQAPDPTPAAYKEAFPGDTGGRLNTPEAQARTTIVNRLAPALLKAGMKPEDLSTDAGKAQALDIAKQIPGLSKNKALAEYDPSSGTLEATQTLMEQADRFQQILGKPKTMGDILRSAPTLERYATPPAPASEPDLSASPARSPIPFNKNMADFGARLRDISKAKDIPGLEQIASDLEDFRNSGGAKLDIDSKTLNATIQQVYSTLRQVKSSSAGEPDLTALLQQSINRLPKKAKTAVQ